MRESTIQNMIRLALSKIPGVTSWRNNTGMAWTGNDTLKVTIKNIFRAQNDLRPGDLIIRNPRPFRAGLCEGSSDLIGLKTITITQDMVGQQVGQFIAVEVKTKTGRVSKKQQNFTDHINKLGGSAIVARSEDDLEPLK